MGSLRLLQEFRKDIQWFLAYLPHTNGVFIIHADDRVPIQLYIDMCAMGCGIICQHKVYHTTFPAHVLNANHPISHLDAPNLVLLLSTGTHAARARDSICVVTAPLRWQSSNLAGKGTPSYRHAPGSCGWSVQSLTSLWGWLKSQRRPSQKQLTLSATGRWASVTKTFQ